jgi:hypothetical protein
LPPLVVARDGRCEDAIEFGRFGFDDIVHGNLMVA